MADNEIIQAFELLSFYASLPPINLPIGRNEELGFELIDSYQRELGRELDLTRLLPLRGLIIMGHLSQSPLPIPVEVDRWSLDSDGWTIVRWVGSVEE